MISKKLRPENETWKQDICKPLLSAYLRRVKASTGFCLIGPAAFHSEACRQGKSPLRCTSKSGQTVLFVSQHIQQLVKQGAAILAAITSVGLIATNTTTTAATTLIVGRFTVKTPPQFRGFPLPIWVFSPSNSGEALFQSAVFETWNRITHSTSCRDTPSISITRFAPYALAGVW